MKHFKSDIMIHRLGKILKGRGEKKALADVIGTSPSVISDLCSGKDRLNDDLIEKISAALGMPPWQLFVDPESVYPAEYQKIIKAYIGLPDGLKNAVNMIMFPENEIERQRSSLPNEQRSGI